MELPDVERKHIVYKHTSPSGRSYIGYTKNRESREKDHKRANGDNPVFHAAVHKYGWDNIKTTILEEGLTLEEAKDSEIYYIKLFDTYNNGYNCTEGGDSGPGLSGKEHPAALPVKIFNNSTQEELEFDWQGEAAMYLGISRKNILNVIHDTDSSTQTFSPKHDAWFQIKLKIDQKDWNKNPKIWHEKLKKPIIVVNIDTKEQMLFSCAEDASISLKISKTQIYNMLSDTSRNKQMYGINKLNRYDVQYDPPSRQWHFNVEHRENLVIAFDQDDNDDYPVYEFSCASEAARQLNMNQGNIISCVRHDRLHAGKKDGKKLRWEYKDHTKRALQKERVFRTKISR